MPEKFRPFYAMMIPLALANGVFECEAEVIQARVFQYLFPSMTIEKVKDLIRSFIEAGLLETWTEPDGKVWGFWTGIDKAGRLPGRKRWGKNERVGPTPRNSSYLLENGVDAIERSTSSTPKPKPEPKPMPKQEPKPEDFALFWESYPRKVAKPEALSSWGRIPKDQRAKVLIGVESWKACEQWKDGTFVPYPATFLNRRQWQDEPPANSIPKVSRNELRDLSVRTETQAGLGPEVHRPLPQVHAPVQPDLLRAVSTVAAKKGF